MGRSIVSVLNGSERGAAWLAHQSGGLGVQSSNLSAPTNKPQQNKPFSHTFRSAFFHQNGTEQRQSAKIGTEIPEKVPNQVLRSFTGPPDRRDEAAFDE